MHPGVAMAVELPVKQSAAPDAIQIAQMRWVQHQEREEQFETVQGLGPIFVVLLS